MVDIKYDIIEELGGFSDIAVDSIYSFKYKEEEKW